MTFFRRLALLASILIFSGVVQHVTASQLTGQSARVEIVLPKKEKLAIDTPAIRARGMIVAKNTADLIRNGFPARLHFKLERWTGKSLVNEIEATAEWEVIVEYDALKSIYRVVRATSAKATVIGEFKDIKAADAAVASAYKPEISLPRKGEKSYYAVTLDVEAMSMSDLDEVRRWIKGELKPAVRGRRNPGTAITKGIRRFFVKMLGGERIRYQSSTDVFTP